MMGRVYTYSEARQNLATVLENAAREGEVRVKRRDGQVFVIRPQTDRQSPLDVDGVDLQLSREEIIRSVREGRRVYGGQE
jgi:PHD/YefM family antitoxin component YafN of YafNO toxin-antitoxin module